MKPERIASVEDFHLRSRMEAVRRRLLADRTGEHLDRALAFWALPSDRRLPLAFLGRSLRDILSTPLDDLYSTPGIGNKKIESLVKLLERAADKPSLGQPSENNGTNGHHLKDAQAPGEKSFNADDVSEGMWLQWRETVRSHQLNSVKLGQLATTLQVLPTVIWNKPIGDYLKNSLTEIRQLKTHGEKRVRAILEVFYHLHRSLANVPADSPYAVQLIPAFVRPLENWLSRIFAERQAPTYNELLDGLVRPLLAQINIDCGSSVAELARQRLGVDGAVHSVKHQSEAMGVTRARVYQLLGECAQVIQLRWPDGRQLMQRLDQIIDGADDHRVVSLCDTIKELFFPEKNGTVLPDSTANQIAEPIGS